MPVVLLERAPGLDPIDLRIELERAIAHTPGGSAGVASWLVLNGAALDDVRRFQVALALAARIDDRAASMLLEGLSSATSPRPGRSPDSGSAPEAPPQADVEPVASPEIRPYLVFALRGSASRETTARLADLYLHDDDERVRSQAAGALWGRGEAMEPDVRRGVLEQAHRDLLSEEPSRVEAAADVLGSDSLSDGDRDFLETVLRDSRDAHRRKAALRALATSGVAPGELAALLLAVENDPTAGTELRDMAYHLRVSTGREQ